MACSTQHPINAGIDAAIRHLTSQTYECLSMNAAGFARAITPLDDILRAVKPGTQDEHIQAVAELLARYMRKGSVLKLSVEQVETFLFELDELRVVSSNLVRLTPAERFLIEALRDELAGSLPAEHESIDLKFTRKQLAITRWTLFSMGTHQRCPCVYAAITRYTAEVHRQKRINRWQLAWFIDQIEELLDRAAFSESQSDKAEECICPCQDCIEAGAGQMSARFYLPPIIPSDYPIFMSSDLEFEIEYLKSIATNKDPNARYMPKSLDHLDHIFSEPLPPKLALTLRLTLQLLYEKLCGFTNSKIPFRSVAMRSLLLATLVFLEDTRQTRRGQDAYEHTHGMYIEVSRRVIINREQLERFLATVKFIIEALLDCVPPVK